MSIFAEYVTISPLHEVNLRHPKRPKLIPFQIHVLAATLAKILALVTSVLLFSRRKDSVFSTISSFDRLPENHDWTNLEIL